MVRPIDDQDLLLPYHSARPLAKINCHRLKKPEQFIAHVAPSTALSKGEKKGKSPFSHDRETFFS
jgi:hypothetical protein